MSQPKAQQATKDKRTISVTTMKISIAIETTEESNRYLSQHKKLGRNRANMLKRKMFVATRRIMSRQDPKVGGHKKMAAKRFCVATQGNHVATQIRLLHHSYAVTLPKFVTT